MEMPKDSIKIYLTWAKKWKKLSNQKSPKIYL